MTQENKIEDFVVNSMQILTEMGLDESIAKAITQGTVALEKEKIKEQINIQHNNQEINYL